MIVILCDDYRDAKVLYRNFCDFLSYEGIRIVEIFENAYAVRTDEDLTYLFTHYKMQPYLDYLRPDYINSDEFIFGMEDGYDFSF